MFSGADLGEIRTGGYLKEGVHTVTVSSIQVLPAKEGANYDSAVEVSFADAKGDIFNKRFFLKLPIKNLETAIKFFKDKTPTDIEKIRKDEENDAKYRAYIASKISVQNVMRILLEGYEVDKEKVYAAKGDTYEKYFDALYKLIPAGKEIQLILDSVKRTDGKYYADLPEKGRAFYPVGQVLVKTAKAEAAVSPKEDMKAVDMASDGDLPF